MSETATANTPLVTGVLAEKKDDQVVLTLPGTDYRLQLVLKTPLPASAEMQIGKRVSGKIHARAKRVDVVRSGGRFIEPVYGRPRRLQGRVIATDSATNTITLVCGCPVIATLTDERQKAGAFEVGQLVAFDIERGAWFELA